VTGACDGAPAFYTRSRHLEGGTLHELSWVRLLRDARRPARPLPL